VTTLNLRGEADVIADVTDEAARRQVAAQVGPVDVLVNSAGIVGANKPCLRLRPRSGAASSTSTSWAPCIR
jgi:3-oxoacyl-[acyl-carrier protein] reductase